MVIIQSVQGFVAALAGSLSIGPINDSLRLSESKPGYYRNIVVATALCT